MARRALADGAAWGAWQAWEGSQWHPSASVLAESLDGGQSFRWYPTSGGTWIGSWADEILEIRRDADKLLWRACHADPDAPDRATAFRRYFGEDHDWAALVSALPWRSDTHLAQCLAVYPELRILRQPFGETLLGFLCSATKQIVQIKQMVALLAERFGTPLAPSNVRAQLPTGLGYRLPTWSQLAEVSDRDLRGCLLGFRARYIHKTAVFLARHPGWLEATEAAPYAEAKERLMELPGVGEKVADCVLLFGAGRLEAFPVDVWVLKSLARRYGLHGWKPRQVAQFGRVHFGPLAGLAQQFLFAWERRHGGR